MKRYKIICSLIITLTFIFNLNTYVVTAVINQQTTVEDNSKAQDKKINYKDKGIIFKSTMTSYENSGGTIVTPATSYIVLEQRWIVTPYQYDEKYWVTYTPYLVSDNYQCPTEVINTITGSVEATVNLGFSGSINTSDATKYGLSVTESSTVKAAGSFSSQMKIPGWTAKGIRAYVKWGERFYKGQLYTKYMFSGTIYEKTEWLYSTDKYLRNYGVKYWEVYNGAHDPNASTPNSPVGWDG